MASLFILAVLVGGITGAITEWSVLHLPFSLEPLSNSAAPWVLVAFVMALTARTITGSLLLAVASLVAEVLGFYIAEAARGWAVSGHQVVFWSVVSVVVGPLVGLAASWLRRGSQKAAALGAGIIGGLLAGEAVYGLTSLRFSTPAAYWRVQFAVGIGLAIVLTLSRVRPRGHATAAFMVSMSSCAVIGLGTLAAYRVP
jgi:uncharacterized membrane protein YeaQ/YmgE (transglycosylase-associated protein family)